MARIDDSYIIPTALYYDGRRPTIGRDAHDRCPTPERLVEDFKIELGATDPDSLRRAPSVENSPRRTAVGLAKDFFDETIKKINTWLEAQGLALPTRILIAEPLSLGGTDVTTEAWLSNYRRAVRKALGTKFKEVDFMPEPFAVFQYYRYGLRHWAVADHKKHIALVLDFGGGTFDVCVVETTKTGDISGGGVNSRPLGAKSLQIGGFAINRMLAESFLFQALGPKVDKSEVKKSLKSFYENKNADEEYLDSLNERRRAFFRHMKKLLQSVERAKLSVCQSIANWSLAADLSGVSSYPLAVPTDPFIADCSLANIRFDAGRLRTLFETQIWDQHLKGAVRSTIERGRAEINGQDVTVVLLSGGSSNIRWLKPLIERDLRSFLVDAQVVELSEDFQEIVAKGLATECARRFYTGGQGDFRGVTYNRLCLLLKADEGEIEIRQFRPQSEPLKEAIPKGVEFDDGILLPVASRIRGLIDLPLRWKVKLAKPPKHNLHYYFMRSSFDPEDLDARHNIVETRVQTPPGTHFQQSIEVELTVSENGTAEPRFIYGHDSRREGTTVLGRPFYMDMTFAGQEVTGETYLGFDFGTSTSSCSYVDSRDIQVIEQRGKQSEWRDLSDLVSDLPYPAASALARYMSETDQARRLDRGRSAVEALLTLAAYITLADHCATAPAITSCYFKDVAHRSAGPLWKLLKSALGNFRLKWTFAAPLQKIVERDGNLEQIDTWITQIANSKHDRASNIDYVSFLSILGNHVSKVFAECKFGVFEGVTAKRFAPGQFKGIFRILSGASQTFIHVVEYQGVIPFSDGDVYLVNTEKGEALCLSPLFMWGLNQNVGGTEEPDLYAWDSYTRSTNEHIFKATQFREEFRIDATGDFVETHSTLTRFKEKDVSFPIYTGLSLISRQE
jgi:hypothetical protein